MKTETKPNGYYGFLGGIIGGTSTTTIRENNFNTDKFDRTSWYALSNKFISEFKDWGL